VRVFAVVLAVIILCAAQAAVAGVDELLIGGRYMWDATVWSGAEEQVDGAWDDVDFVNGTETRRALAAGDEIGLKDAYLDLVGVPGVGNIRVGQGLEPLCFNELTSSKYISFIERASLNAFAPSRNTGVMVHDKAVDGKLNYQVGFFLDTGPMATTRSRPASHISSRARRRARRWFTWVAPSTTSFPRRACGSGSAPRCI
jgi:hypothetical protein